MKAVGITSAAWLSLALAGWGGPLVTHGIWQEEAGRFEVHHDGPEEQGMTLWAWDGPVFRPGEATWEIISEGKGGVLLDDFDFGATSDSFRFYTVTEGEEPSPGAGTVLAARLQRFRAGPNWIGLWGNVEGRSADEIFGRSLPAGEEPETSTRLGRVTAAGEVEWFAWRSREHAGWQAVREAGPGLPSSGAVVVELPAAAGETTYPVGVRMATKAFVLNVAPGSYAAFSSRTAGGVALRELGLVEAGISAAAFSPTESDEIRLLSPRGEPETRILLDPEDDRLEYWTGGERGAPAGELRIGVDRMVVLYARKSGKGIKGQLGKGRGP